MKLQQLLSYTRKAVDDYNLIDEGDHIALCTDLQIAAEGTQILLGIGIVVRKRLLRQFLIGMFCDQHFGTVQILDLRIVVDNKHAVTGEMDVGLNTAGTVRDRTEECFFGIRMEFG